ncbi:hypothetical protein Prudu_178S000200 [Prunus dulcis]|uniref:Uncharacterized protein n=1 Tax=Prunus dulcis TaxID=3755 RepID=A0A5H2XH66_PRUDU|nr:hypothetical protein Prudu_178S000200 [Prunus dulcis]
MVKNPNWPQSSLTTLTLPPSSLSSLSFFTSSPGKLPAHTSMDGKGSASASGSALPTLDLNALLGRLTLDKHLETENPFDNNKITPFYQRIFRSLIGAISELESRGITRGYLQPHQIMVGGGPCQFVRAWLLPRPEEDNPTAPTFRKQFDSLVRMILGERDLSNLELNNFLHITASAASGGQSLFNFRQLQWHPILLSSAELPQLVYLVFDHLDMRGTSSWKEDFRQMIQRDVEVRDTVLGVDYFSDVYNLEGPQYYEENALGAFLFSANAISDVNGYIRKAFKQYMTDEEKDNKLMSVEQIFDMLISFFPHMLIDVYDFLVKKGLPIDGVL